MKFVFLSLSILINLSLLNGAAIKGRPSAAQSRPFYGTKSAAQQQQQEEEGSLPGFVEPPEAPAPEPDAGEPMMPYSFEYTANGPDGGSSRREVNDGTRVTGTYTMNGADGIQRIVHYVADKDGYRATIVTNEPGTESQSPAATILNSSQLPAEQLALQYGPREPAERAAPVRFPGPIPPVPAFASARSAALRSTTSATSKAPSSPTTTLRASSFFPTTQTTALPARLVADSGVKGAPIVQQRIVAPPPPPAPIKSAQQVKSPIRQRPLPPPPPPPPTQQWTAVTAHRAPSKTRVTRPPPPPPPPTPAAIRVLSKTAPVKSRTVFYQTTTTTTTPAPAQIRQEQQFEEVQQYEEPQQQQQQQEEEPQQQIQQQERLQEQEVEVPQSQEFDVVNGFF